MTVPENAFWYHLAYGVTIVAYVSYAASLWWRKRRLRRGRATAEMTAYSQHGRS